VEGRRTNGGNGFKEWGGRGSNGCLISSGSGRDSGVEEVGIEIIVLSLKIQAVGLRKYGWQGHQEQGGWKWEWQPGRGGSLHPVDT
jgi:hypothetical protein